MNKAVVFLGICIFLSALVIGGAWVYNTQTVSNDRALYDRYDFGAKDNGISSVADKVNKPIYYPFSGSTKAFK